MNDKYPIPQSNMSSSLHTTSNNHSSLLYFKSDQLWSASEPRRFASETPLSLFLKNLLRDQQLTIRDACKIAGISPSVLHGWLFGSYPVDTVIHLKKLANRFGYSLAEALTGAPDDMSGSSFKKR